MSVDLLKTVVLLAALKTRLEAINHPTIGGAKLFEVVAYHEDKNLAEALRELIIIKKRVCLLVPAGDSFEKDKDGRKIRSVRTTSLDIVMADQAYTKGGQDAAFGGDNNVGVVVMKEMVIEDLGADAQLGGLRWCALYPTDGAFLTISEDEAKKLSGRQAYVLNYETPSGEIIAENKTPWTN